MPDTVSSNSSSRPVAIQVLTRRSVDSMLQERERQIASGLIRYTSPDHVPLLSPRLDIHVQSPGSILMPVLGGAAFKRCIFNSRLGHTFISRPISSTSRRPPRPLKKKNPGEPKDKWNYNKASFSEIPEEDVNDYKLVNANELEREMTPPGGVKMLVRDFIEDSLYNPHYGYFVKQATIFDTKSTQFDFPSLRDSTEFQEEVAKKYTAYGLDKPDGPGRQLWHTPTELFKVAYRRLFYIFVNLTLLPAVVWTGYCSLPGVGVPSQVFSI